MTPIYSPLQHNPMEFFPMGNCHHADFLKQSPPFTTAEHKEFMRGELKRMVEAGFNVYNMEFGWFDMEIRQDQWDFGRTDAVFEICQELNLPFFAWMFAELTPRWLTKQYPETAAVAATGYRGPSHSYGSSFALERARNFMHTVIRRYGDSPLCLGYNVGIESGLFWIEEQDSPEPAARIWDYNPEVVAGFAPWLEGKYGTIEELNRIYRDHYDNFTEVEPPNSRYIQEQFMLINQVGWLDWRLYMIDVLTHYIHFKAEAVRELKPDALVSDQSYVIDPAKNAQDIWKVNTKMDVVGTSMFVSNNPGDFTRADYWEDYFRCSARGKPYWIWELRCGQNAWGITNWGLPVSVNDVSRFTWQAIGQDCKSIQYWNWRPHIGGVEVGGHGFTLRDGSLTDRAVRVGNIARLLNQHSEWFHRAHMPQAKIALLDSPLSRIIAAGEGSDYLVQESQIGAYNLFKSLGYYLDIIREEEIQVGMLENYKLLVVPFAYAMQQKTGPAIRDWVGQGGFLFSGMWCGAKDDFGFGQFLVPGFGLDQVFGAAEAKLTPIYSERDNLQTNMQFSFDWNISGRPRFQVVNPLTPEGKAQAGDHFKGFCYVSSMQVYPGAEVIARDERQEVVAVCNHFGRGQALMVGTLLIPEKEFAVSGLSRLAEDFAQLAGIECPVLLQNRGDAEVEAKLLEHPDGSALLILLNNETQPMDLSACLPGVELKEANDLESDTAITFINQPQGAILRLSLAAGDGRAIMVKISRE
jgi:beta-galactosidase GanA